MRHSSTLAIALLLFLPRSAPAFHHVTPTLVQITPVSGAGTIANQQWAGIRFVIFDSDLDLLGTGSTGRQAYLFDLQERDLLHSQALLQLTSGPGDSQRASSGKRGVKIVYDAQPGGAGPRQIFLLDRHSGARYALTQGTADSLNAQMDDGSRMVVFESTADFFSTGIPGTQIYRIDLRSVVPDCPYPCAATGNAGLKQITRSNGTSQNAVVSTGGKVIAFESNADPRGLGDKETEIYTYNVKNALFTRLCHGIRPSRNPTISHDGGLVAFESDADLLRNGTAGTQIFLYKRTALALQQISDRPIGHSTGPSLSANGHALAFISSDDLLSNGSLGPEVFSYDLRTGVMQQITNGPNTTSKAAYAGGVFTTFLSDGDLLGNGTSSTALYLTNLFRLGSQTIP